MQGGFSFCGVNIARFGLEYVPPLNDTYVFAPSPYEAHQEVFDAHHGGYFYGATVQPKDFNLKCYFQDKHIAHGVLDRLLGFFQRGKTGKLIFDNRNWIWYAATVMNVDTTELQNYKNGFVTISLRAYYPFARHDYISIKDENMFSDYLAENSGLLPDNITPSPNVGALTSSTNLLLYNGGTEYADVAISLAGNAGEGITITNHTTNQSCRFIALTKSNTTNLNKYIVSDSLNGKTILTDGSTTEFAFIYHDYGFIQLAPSFPIIRDVYISYSANSNKIDTSNIIDDINVIGKHIRVNSDWYKITSFDEDGKLVIDKTLSTNGNAIVDIVQMNEIEVKLEAGAELTKLDFNYKPTFK